MFDACNDASCFVSTVPVKLHVLTDVSGDLAAVETGLFFSDRLWLRRLKGEKGVHEKRKKVGIAFPCDCFLYDLGSRVSKQKFFLCAVSGYTAQFVARMDGCSGGGYVWIYPV